MLQPVLKQALVSTVKDWRSPGAGFNNAWTKTKPSATGVGARQDDYIKGICSSESNCLNPGRTQLYRAAVLLHTHQQDISSLIS